MIDLDALERRAAFDGGAYYITPEETAALVAELRAARKAVEAARPFTSQIKPTSIHQRMALYDALAALAELWRR